MSVGWGAWKVKKRYPRPPPDISSTYADTYAERGSTGVIFRIAGGAKRGYGTYLGVEMLYYHINI